MDIDARLQQLWQQQQPPHALSQQLLDRVRRQQRWMHLWRALELLLSVAVLGWFAHLFWTQALSPRHWLLLPFFSVFLVANWAVVLRHSLRSRTAVLADAAAYAGRRQLQLRQSLVGYKLASHSAAGLLVYAALAFVASALMGEDSWRQAALILLAYATLWFFGTRWLVQRKRRSALREYRAMRRISSAACGAI